MSRDETYLEHFLKAIAKIDQYAAVGRQRFYAESVWQDAIIRQLEIIGEARNGCRPICAPDTQRFPGAS